MDPGAAKTDGQSEGVVEGRCSPDVTPQQGSDSVAAIRGSTVSWAAGGRWGARSAAAPQRPDRSPWAGTDSAATSGAAGGAQGLRNPCLQLRSQVRFPMPRCTYRSRRKAEFSAALAARGPRHKRSPWTHYDAELRLGVPIGGNGVNCAILPAPAPAPAPPTTVPQMIKNSPIILRSVLLRPRLGTPQPERRGLASADCRLSGARSLFHYSMNR